MCRPLAPHDNSASRTHNNHDDDDDSLPSPSPLEPAAGPGDGDRLIHHPLADAEILVDPLLHLLVLARDLLRLETGPDGSPRMGRKLVACSLRRFEVSRREEKRFRIELTSDRSSASCRQGAPKLRREGQQKRGTKSGIPERSFKRHTQHGIDSIVC